MKELGKELKMAIQYIVKTKDRIVYKIKKKICDLLYGRATYIPEKGMWVSTVVFPVEITDGVCGVTDVFKGNKKKVENWTPIHSEYINKRSDAKMIHQSIVEDMKTGYIAILG